MPLVLRWDEIALRLCLTVLAGALIGLNRSSRGRPAGIRTTILVCLAASVSMIQANLLLGTAGKAGNSFVVLDLMRLPLGILSGMGFIGAGVIVRKGSLVTGVTTAATLWFVTVVGLCFGGGQIGIGLVAVALGLIVLWCLKWVEDRLGEDRMAKLILRADADGPADDEIHRLLSDSDYRVISSSVLLLNRAQSRETSFQVKWRAAPEEHRTPSFVAELARSQGVERVEWKPIQVSNQ